MTDSANILFIDDEPKAGELFKRLIRGTNYQAEVYDNPQEALKRYAEQGADLIITDLSMPEMTGLELLEAVRKIDLEVPVIIITGYSTIDNAVEAMRLGASDFIKKPYDIDELLMQIERSLEATRLKRENRMLRRQIKDEKLRYGMIGKSDAMQAVYKVIDKVADIRCNVIIEGESGTGKELVARALHNTGPDADKPFIVIDCGALTDTLLESELFGHEKGAFTGATHTKQGLLEAASGGTIFLDEICNISDNMQTKLMRVVQEQQILRVGGVRPIDIDVRFVVATNRNIESMVEMGKFRHDLYHRLNVVKIQLPPLRERRNDIPLLIQAAIAEFSQKYHRDITGFDHDSVEALLRYDWAGNVRELRNLVERHVALAESPELHLMDGLQVSPVPSPGQDCLDHDQPDLQTLEQRYIEKVLAAMDGNREKTAAALGINKSTLWRKLQQYQS
jgi:DNA-binding NtrC family response regulator